MQLGIGCAGRVNESSISEGGHLLMQPYEPRQLD